MSGIDLPGGLSIRKGAPDAVIRFVARHNGAIPSGVKELVEAVASKGASPLAVAEGPQSPAWWCWRTS